jgi:hypothetical protein
VDAAGQFLMDLQDLPDLAVLPVGGLRAGVFQRQVPGTEISPAGIAGALRQGLTGLLTPSPVSRRSDCMIWNVVV